MKKTISVLITVLLVVVLASMMSVGAFAAAEPAAQTDETVAIAAEAATNDKDVTVAKAIAAAAVVAIVGAAAALGMAKTIAASTESMARQPEIAGKINSTMMLGIVFIETAIIYALIIAILVIFVL